MTFWITDWLIAFAITLGVESLVAIPLLEVEPQLLPRAAGVALANLATHPLVWFASPGLALPLGVRIGLAELFAVIVEGWAYHVIWRQLRVRRGLLISLGANACSFLLGLLMRGVFR